MFNLTPDWIEQLPIQSIQSYKPISGGDINKAYQINTDHDQYFMKVQPGRGKQFFAHEVEGLKLLGQVANVPSVIDYGEINGDGFLILGWLDQSAGSQFELGQMVAKVHQVHQPKFGLDHNFDIGKIPKNNQWQSNWGTFYIEQRLKPVVQLAKQANRWNDSRQRHFERIIKIIHDYYQDHPVTPSLLHGDLWSGNYTFAYQKPYLIDPDVFYGNREMDIAMTTVFGGFDQDFYDGYNSVYPLDANVNQRLPWYRLYYLMVHLVLFGETYGSAVDQILESF
ncbi:fructosamine kinase family protein [Nicoliella lavandulae]|uniref:Fructosamine kinase family protein n=1 Tax=Nicoliella lavandulae TaxID=3082954 RepID=A0ABU8SLB2_9LACO